MSQKILIISATISTLILSLLFILFLKSVNTGIYMEQARAYGYLHSVITTEIKQTQGEILNLFEYYSELSRKIRDKNRKISIDELKIFNNEISINSSFPKIISFTGYIDLTDNIKYFPIKESRTETINYLSYAAIWESMNLKRSREVLYIEDFQGFIALPLNRDNNDNITGIVMLGINLNPLINTYLSDLIIERFKNNDFIISLQYGYVLLRNKKLTNFDAIIDLNRAYNFKNRDDYFIRKDLVNSISFKMKHIMHNHLYITVNSGSDNISSQYTKKRSIYNIGLIILYIIFSSSIITLFYTAYKIKYNMEREQLFTSLISHELKTPLSVIRLGADNLTSGVINNLNDFKYYGEMIDKESARLQSMIENVLMVSTRSWNNGKNELVPEDVASIITEIESNMEYLLEKFNVVINYKITCEYKNIFCHRSSLIAAVQNVVRNGIIYGASQSDDKRVLIEITECKKRNKTGISILIRDFGPGIKSHEWNKIFRSYYRGDIAKKKQIPGSGLGLHITRRIIEDFKGSITLYKSYKKGSCFEIWLPQRI